MVSAIHLFPLSSVYLWVAGCTLTFIICIYIFIGKDHCKLSSISLMIIFVVCVRKCLNAGIVENSVIQQLVKHYIVATTINYYV